MDFLDVIRSESARFSALARQLAPQAPVPTCPGWTGADLVYHLAEVQDFWAYVAVGSDGEDVAPLPRPENPAALPGLFDDASRRLATALAGADPGDACWSWDDDGHHVGWVLRRQAHEALIHRVDAELAAGVPVTPVADELAADGVDEILAVMVAGVPGWSSFHPDGAAVRLEVADGAQAGRSWTLRVGRFRGVGPDSGREWDLPAAELTEDPATARTAVPLVGGAWELDRWLWGRGTLATLEALEPEQRAVAEGFRAMVAATTQ
ncbi:maleylpyruvate isomerase N-terminal domain-containing protein [Georgenia faecalis]|uniref:maleylpyruvate isomerase N-terminal domain-containing protein n=1 Tax=Georgenia faecalis TaxID=2483799 RepID=UPI000FD81A92|nr:maleylpyruvate isomerase N-terminal domain-containing protein [Georgenia faecalis]